MVIRTEDPASRTKAKRKNKVPLFLSGSVAHFYHSTSTSIWGTMGGADDVTRWVDAARFRCKTKDNIGSEWLSMQASWVRSDGAQSESMGTEK